MVAVGCPIRTPFRTCLEVCGIENCKKPDCRRPSSGEIDQPQLQAVDYSHGPVGDPQLRDDVLDVVLGRTEADYEVPSDLTVGASHFISPRTSSSRGVRGSTALPTYSGEISVPTSLNPPMNNWPTTFMVLVRSPRLQGTRTIASSCRSHKWDNRRNEGTGLRAALDLEFSTKHAYPLPHSRKTDPLTRTAPQRFECGRVEPTPEIPDLQIDFCVPPPQLYLQPLRPRVLAYVGQRLLRDAEERDLHRSWQALISKMFLAVDPVTFFIQAFDLQGDGGCESEVVECRWPQVRDDPARIRDCRPYLPEYPIQLSPALLRLWDVAPGEGLQILMCGNRNLGQTVVNFVGHPASLLFLGSQQPRYQVLQRTLPVSQLLVEPGVLESARNLAGQATYYVVVSQDEIDPPLPPGRRDGRAAPPPHPLAPGPAFG